MPAVPNVPARGVVRIGCSGWQYRHWRGDFYPAALSPSVWLEHYARTFDTVEVNGSFYRLPEVPAVLEWRARTPAGFLFAWKASRFLTHMKKLKDPAEPIERLMERARPLGPKLGPNPLPAPAALEAEPGAPGDVPRCAPARARAPRDRGA